MFSWLLPEKKSTSALEYMKQVVQEEKIKREKWDLRFLHLAKHIAQWSKDPSTKTGAVIVRPDRTIASVGYNGFPRGTKDDNELYTNRDVKLQRIVHCEMNAVLSAREPLKGYTLYTWPFLSCDRCAAHMIQAGITRVVGPFLPEPLEARWGESIEKTLKIFAEAHVTVTQYDFK